MIALRGAAVMVLGLLGLAGCQGRDADLDTFIERTRQEQATGVKPLPEIRPYESFSYSAQGVRSPFQPSSGTNSTASGPRPDSHRNREFLEQFPLDTLRMVGTLNLSGKNYGLVMARDGLIHRVLPGNHLGQNDGRITAINASKMNVIEIVPDGLGGFMERPAALSVTE